MDQGQSKTENRKLKTRPFLLFLAIALIILAAACGKKMMPLPPDKVLPAPVRQFSSPRKATPWS